jgi:hypothetical protein
MNILKFPNFISSVEAEEMSRWVLENKEKSFFKPANMGGIRLTTRYSTSEYFNYPKIVLSIREKIINLFNLQEEERLNLKPDFKNGIVASCAFPGDTCFVHIDPIWHGKYNTLHCNVITQSPDKGGDLILDGFIEPMRELELSCYLVSRIPHGTTLVQGKKERLMWVFGFCIDNEKWEKAIRLNKG